MNKKKSARSLWLCLSCIKERSHLAWFLFFLLSPSPLFRIVAWKRKRKPWRTRAWKRSYWNRREVLILRVVNLDSVVNSQMKTLKLERLWPSVLCWVWSPKQGIASNWPCSPATRTCPSKIKEKETYVCAYTCCESAPLQLMKGRNAVESRRTDLKTASREARFASPVRAKIIVRSFVFREQWYPGEKDS